MVRSDCYRPCINRGQFDAGCRCDEISILNTTTSPDVLMNEIEKLNEEALLQRERAQQAEEMIENLEYYYND